MALHASGSSDGCDPKWNVTNGYLGCWLVSVIEVLHAIDFVDHIAMPPPPGDAIAAALLRMRDVNEAAIDDESVRACQTQLGNLDAANFEVQLRKVFSVYGWKDTLNHAQWCGLTLLTDGAAEAVTPFVHLDVTTAPGPNAPAIHVQRFLRKEPSQLQSIGNYLLVTCDSGNGRVNVDISDFSVTTINGDVSLALVVVVVFHKGHYVRYVKVSPGKWVLRDSRARTNGEVFVPTCRVATAPKNSLTPNGNAVFLVYKNRSQLGCTPLPPPTDGEHDDATRRGFAQHGAR